MELDGPNYVDVQATSPCSPVTAMVASAAMGTPPGSRAAFLRSEIEAGVCVPMDSPIIRVGPRLRKSRTPATVLSIGRSTWLAAKPRASNATLQAQALLMQKLGLLTIFLWQMRRPSRGTLQPLPIR